MQFDDEISNSPTADNEQTQLFVVHDFYHSRHPPVHLYLASNYLSFFR